MPGAYVKHPSLSHRATASKTVGPVRMTRPGEMRFPSPGGVFARSGEYLPDYSRLAPARSTGKHPYA